MLTRRQLISAAIPGAWVSSSEFATGSQTAGIQEAHDALPKTGGIITVPSGEHIIQRGVEITKDGVTICGTGALFSNRGSDRLGTRIRVARGATMPAAFYVHKGRDGIGYGASFVNLAIDGGWQYGSMPPIHGIWIYQDGRGGEAEYMGHNVLSNVMVTNFSGKGIWIENASCIDVGYMEHVSARGTLSDCMAITGNDWTLVGVNVGGACDGTGLLVMGNRVEVIGGESDFNSRYGACIDGDRISFVNFKSECSRQAGLVIAGYSKRTTVIGGQFNNNGTAGIQISPSASDTVIQGVQCWNLPVHERQQDYGIWISGGHWIGPLLVTGSNLRGNRVAAWRNDTPNDFVRGTCLQ